MALWTFVSYHHLITVNHSDFGVFNKIHQTVQHCSPQGLELPILGVGQHFSALVLDIFVLSLL